MTLKLWGVYTALITPFQHKQSLDERAFEKIIEHQSHAGVPGVVLAGSTGEGHLLREGERGRIYDMARSLMGESITLVAGCCDFSPDQAAESVMHAQRCHMNAVMIAPPPYIKPCQEGVYHYFKSIHDKTHLPIIIYNHPGRTGTSIACDTLLRLHELPRIIALKEADTDLSRMSYLRARLGKDFFILSGDDSTLAASLAMSSDGCISVASNVVPDVMCALIEAWQYRNIQTFFDIQRALQPLFEILAKGGNPSVIKAVMSSLGFCENILRDPLRPVSSDLQESIKKHLLTLDILQKGHDDLVKPYTEYGFSD
jgi:4-hydroxy-tetrahydrodipicolinate synthase